MVLYTSSATFQLRDFVDLEGLITQLARYCLDHNLYRQTPHSDHPLTPYMAAINAADRRPNKAVNMWTGGYMFLDEPNGTAGMVRLYYTTSQGNGNPKWSFWMEDGQLKVDDA
jgi:hypothetical protein